MPTPPVLRFDHFPQCEPKVFGLALALWSLFEHGRCLIEARLLLLLLLIAFLLFILPLSSGQVRVQDLVVDTFLFDVIQTVQKSSGSASER